MTKRYRYAIAIVGEMTARNRAQAYMTVQMCFSINGRLLEFPNDVSIQVLEISEPLPDPSVAEQLFRGKEVD